MGGPAKIGYSGGKLKPKENDRINGMVAAKSLQTLVAGFIYPGSTVKVFHIKAAENAIAIIKTI